MTTETIKTFTPSITWKEIPLARRNRIREFLKRAGKELGAAKRATRQLQSASDRKITLDNFDELEKLSMRREYLYDICRHLHVVASMARGKSLTEIENPETRKSTTPDLNMNLLKYAEAILQGETRLYILLHPSLTNGQKLAQTAHAAVAFADLQTPWDNDTVIIKDGNGSWKAWQGLWSQGEFATFIDSGLPSELRPAAIAFWGPNAERLLGILPLSN